ncbi:MAG: anthranilate phosphoribosyltransferase [Phycisphaerales bacterium]|nr:anthranilate phosphoribosyltransferase [Phycisphaerales bacterium]
MKETLAELLAGRHLGEQDAERVFHMVLSGQADAAQIGALLALLQAKGVTTDELVGAARVMRAYVTPVPVDRISGGWEYVKDGLVDTCGTGGAPKTFNVSTAAAIVAAAAAPRRVFVAKHGNRSRTGRGSAEVLAALGVNVDAPPLTQARCLERAGVCFCFAIHHHPAMKHAAEPRRSLGFPTIFNLLGPLTNPAGARRQVLGVYERSKVRPVAEALQRLGAERAIVAHGLDGLDEITTTGPTLIGHVRDGKVELEEFDAADAGVRRARLSELQAMSLEESAAMVRMALSGEPGAARDIVAVNAAAALVVTDVAEDFREGIALAEKAMGDGAAMDTLAKLVEVSHSG